MDSNAIELAVTAQSVAETLSIGRSTLNKYSRSLEDAGYTFVKDDRGNRAYTERDIIALRHAITLLAKGVLYDKAMTDAAIKYARSVNVAMGYTDSDQVTAVSTENTDSGAIVASLKQELTSEIINTVNVATNSLRQENEELRSILREALIRMDDVASQNRQLTEILTAQKAIAAAGEDRQEQRERERDEKLTQILRELQESKQQANKSVWSRLFGGGR